MNIAIVDDDDRDIDQISSILCDYASLNLTEIKIDRFTDPGEFLASYIPYKYTLIFLDIFIRDVLGTEVAAKIKEADRNAVIVFLTTSRDHMPAAFSLHAFDYLVKPAEKERVFRMMDDITDQVTSDEQCFTFTEKKIDYSLRYSDIMVVRSNSHYLQIIDKDLAEFKTRMNFSEAEDILASDGRFLLINRGMLVNMDYISDFSDGVCMIDNSIYLPYNVKKHKELEQSYRNYIFAKLRQNSLKG